MLQRVILDIGKAERTEEAGLFRLREELAAEGIDLEWEGEERLRRALPEQTLYVSDGPERIRRRYGRECCIVQYLTEENRKEDFWGSRYAVESLEGLDADFLKKVFARHRGEPWEILRTKRLIVREMTENDLDTLYDIYDGQEVAAFTEELSENREEERKKLAAYVKNVYPVYGFGLWLLVDERSKTGIGQAGFYWREEAAYPELGFVIRRQWQKRGCCTEACRAILNYGFEELGFSGVQAVTWKKNPASVRTLRGLGFTEDGRILRDGRTLRRFILCREEERLAATEETGGCGIGLDGSGGRDRV